MHEQPGQEPPQPDSSPSPAPVEPPTPPAAWEPPVRPQPQAGYGPQHGAWAYAPYPGAISVGGTTWVPAGFGPRLLAFLLDWAILGILHMAIVAIIGVPQPNPDEAMRLSMKLIDDLSAMKMPNASLISELEQFEKPERFSHGILIAICAAYYLIFHGLLGATMGKLVLGLRVLRSDGQPIGFGYAGLRYLIYYLTGWALYTAWLIPLNAEKRTLHDMLLRTNVYKALPQAPPQQYWRG